MNMLQATAVGTFLILFAFKVADVIDNSWWVIFLPLWLCILVFPAVDYLADLQTLLEDFLKRNKENSNEK